MKEGIFTLFLCFLLVEYTPVFAEIKSLSKTVPQNPFAGIKKPVVPITNARDIMKNSGNMKMGGSDEDNQSSDNQMVHVMDLEAGNGDEVISNFDFPDAELIDLVKAVGKLTGVNFILDNDIKSKKVSIISHSKITVKDAWRAFLTALDMNRLTIVPSGKYIRIMKQTSAREKQIRTYVGDTPKTDAYVTSIIQLNHISADDIVMVFRNFSSPDSRYSAYQQTNTLIVSDTAANINRLFDIIKKLDIAGFEETLKVVKIKYTTAAEIATLLDSLIPDIQKSSSRYGGGGFGSSGGTRGFSQRKTAEGGVISQLIADDRTNALIVKANAKGFQQVKELVEKLDVAGGLEGSGKIHVVFIKYGSAEKISETLTNLSAGSGSSMPSMGGLGGMKKASPKGAQLFEGAVKVSPDKDTNSLVITASPSDFKTLKAVINKLDTPRDQVYVESVVMEISSNNSRDFSVNIINPKNGLALTPNEDLFSFLSNPANVAKGGGASFVFGSGDKIKFKLQATDTDDKALEVFGFQAFIKALQSYSIGNLLATPQIMAIDNEESEIEIGDKIFIDQVSYPQNGQPVKTSVPQNITLKLKIKPQINRTSKIVKLDVTQGFDSIGNKQIGTLSETKFSISTRNAKTLLTVEDGDTAVIGGLMRDIETERESKIPILGDIPILGWLFKSSSKNFDKTNLLVFLTPHIIRYPNDSRAITDKKIKERSKYLEKMTGNDHDPFKDTIDEIKKKVKTKNNIEKKEENAKLQGNALTTEEEIKPLDDNDKDKKTNEEISIDDDDKDGDTGDDD